MNKPKLQPLPQPSDATRLTHAWLSSKSRSTQSAYLGDLLLFADHAGHGSTEPCVKELLSLDPLRLTEVLNEYRQAMINADLAGATINRRLATLRSLLKCAANVRMIDYVPHIQDVNATPQRDVRGPTKDDAKRLLEAARDNPRDHAILLLMLVHGLRREEVVSIRNKDVQPRCIYVLRKGQHDRVMIHVTQSVSVALRRYASASPARFLPENAMFFRGHKGSALGGHGVYRLVRKYAEQIGLDVSPHSLRHTSITLAARHRGARKLEDVMQHSGHKNVATLMRYRDAEDGAQLELAESVEAALS